MFENKNNIKGKSTFFLVDIFKFIFSLCIVCIHYGIIYKLKIPYPIDYYIQKLIFRLAVPFFFVTSGFFLAAKYENTLKIQEKKNITILYSKHLSILLIIFNLISILLRINEYIIPGGLIKFLQAIFFYPIGATWFLLACIIGSWCIYFFYKIEKKILILPISTVFYVFALLCNSYFLVSEKIGISSFISKYMQVFVSARNGFFCGFFFLSIGFAVRNKYSKWKNENMLVRNRKRLIFPMVGVYLIFCCEVFFLKNKNHLDDGALFLIMPLFIYLFILFCITYETSRNVKQFKRIRTASTIIYLVHSPILKILQIVWNLIKIKC